MTENTWPDLSALYARPPTHSVTVRRNSAKDLIDCINSYQGEKTIVVPRCTSVLTIDEKVVIKEQGFHLVGYPPKMTEIRLGASGYFSIEKSTDFEDYGLDFEGLTITGTNGALRGISTENMGTTKRVRFLKIHNCVLYNFAATNAVAIKGKNLELAEIYSNRISQTKTALIDLYDDTYSYGNIWLHHNFLYCYSGANPGIGLRINQVATPGSGGNIVSHDNQYWNAVAGSIGISLIEADDVLTTINVHDDRFENIQALATGVATGLIQDLRFRGNECYYALAQDCNIVDLGDHVISGIIANNTFLRGGANKVVGVHDDNVDGNHSHDNHLIGNTFRGFNHAGSSSVYLEKGAGATTIDDHNIYAT